MKKFENKIEKESYNRVIEILSNSFQENKSVLFIVRKPSLIKKLMIYSIKKSLLNGALWINDDYTCCALVINPQKKGGIIRNFLLDIYLLINVLPIQKLRKIFNKETDLKKYHPTNTKFLHLWLIGVVPNQQGKGIGSQMIKELVEYYKGEYDSICLETSTLINLPFYKNQGFDVYKTLNYGFDFFMLKKEI